jgi:hypothetical protein
MEFIRKAAVAAKEVVASATDQKNRAVFGITTYGGIMYGWHLASIHVSHFLTWVFLWKTVVAVFTIFIAPPVGVFMSDVYRVNIRPKIFKKKNHDRSTETRR